MKRIYLDALQREVSVLGFGCASLGSRIGIPQGRRAIDMAIERGVTWFDVAPPYGDGNAEGILGEALRGRRDQIVVCTKFGIGRPNVSLSKRLLRPIARKVVAAVPSIRTTVSRGRQLGQRSPIVAAQITPAVEDSLRRLQSDYIDVLAMHEPTPSEAADDEIHAVLCSLKNRGLVRAISIASTPPAVIAAIDARQKFDFAQFPDTPFDTAAVELRHYLGEHSGVGFVTHGVFGSGAAEKLHLLPEAIKTQIMELLNAYGHPSGQIENALLYFALANNPAGVTITSMFNPSHIERNCAVADANISPEFAIDLRRAIKEAMLS